MRRTLTIAFAALPFAFGAIRAAKTGTDARYLWVALAAGLGTLAVAQIAGRSRPAARALLAFLASGATGIGAALLLGTKLGPGILVVAASFAACFAAAILAAAFARPAMQ